MVESARLRRKMCGFDPRGETTVCIISNYLSGQDVVVLVVSSTDSEHMYVIKSFVTLQNFFNFLCDNISGNLHKHNQFLRPSADKTLLSKGVTVFLMRWKRPQTYPNTKASGSV